MRSSNNKEFKEGLAYKAVFRLNLKERTQVSKKKSASPDTDTKYKHKNGMLWSLYEVQYYFMWSS